MSDLQWNKEFALEQTGGDEELLQELLILFVDSSANDLARLRRGVEESNCEEVVRAAHSIKGASASLGIEAVRGLAQIMEQDARNGSVAAASDQEAALAALLDSVKALL